MRRSIHGKTEIYMVNDDTTGLKRITFSNGFSSHNPAWPPDGKFIVYYFAKCDGEDQLFIVKSDGSGAKKHYQRHAQQYFSRMDWQE